MPDLKGFFSADGPLAQVIENYLPRQAQLEMAQAVARTMANSGILVAEAGTGTGKTFAYLLPSLLSSAQVIVSTGSKNLQDQLFFKDLPVLLKTFKLPRQVTQLKGRGNYLCHYRWQQTMQADFLRQDQDITNFERVQQWLTTTEVGDIAEMAELPENWSGWLSLTSSEDSCLGHQCPFIGDCFLLKARRRAQTADLLVINHHLLCADWALRQDSLGELLPPAPTVIVDEAHQFAETAARFQGDSVTSRQLRELLQDTVKEQQQAALGAPVVRLHLQRLQESLAHCQQSLAGMPPKGLGADLEQLPELARLQARLTELAEALAPLAGASEGLESCWQRSRLLRQRLGEWLGGDKPDWVRWYEAGPRYFTLHSTPLAVADSFVEYRQRDRPGAWIFTSATLSVAGKFDHFLKQLGLAEETVETRLWVSPFDYARQALMYLPPSLPTPNSMDYTSQVVDAAVPVLEASRGRAFFLFTSHRALQEAASRLERALAFPLLVQGSAPKNVLLARFRKLGNAVLLATASFWEGVDVQGSALSCVIIDKLPFAALGDPLFQARLASLRRHGHNPFLDYQLPAAVIALKQGAGRLIRGQKDRGVLMLCDPRLTQKNYGKVFLDSLPPMERTGDLSRVEAFFEGCDENSGD